MNIRVWQILVALCVLGETGFTATGDGQSCPLSPLLDISTERLADSVYVVAIAQFKNASSVVVNVCGIIDFWGGYRPDEPDTTKCGRGPLFFLISDNDVTPTFRCEPHDLPPGGTLVDTLEFAFADDYFTGFPGEIRIEARFFFGTPGMNFNDTDRTSCRVVQSVKVPHGVPSN